MAEFLLDTEAASRLMRAERSLVARMRQSGAKGISISSVSMAELLYGARLREDNPSVMSAVRAFLARILIHAWVRPPPRRMRGFVFLPSARVGARECLML